VASGTVNKRSVDALRPGAGVAFLWDDELKGFGVKITPAGARTYVYQYRMGGREAPSRRRTIGQHGSPWTPTTARKEGERLAVLVAQGVDPVEEEAKRRRDAVELAFTPYSQKFLDSCTGEGWRKMVERELRLHVRPVLENRALPTITRVHVTAVMDRIPADKAALRRNVFAVMRRLLRWAVARGDIERSPMEALETPPAVAARDRVLSDAELVRVWTAAADCHAAFGPIVRLLIATGQRLEEVSGMDWSELDRDALLWRLPRSRTKNGEPHTVPISPIVLGLLDTLVKRAKAKDGKWPKKGLVFSTRNGNPFTAHSRGKRQIDALLKDDPLPPWRLHDLRRTLATGLQRLGVRFEVTEAVLNHLSGSKAGVAGVYQRHTWTEEKRAALDAWSSWLDQLIAGWDRPDNVVQLAKRA